MPKNSAQSTTAQGSKQPAHQYVYEQLRDQILFGELTPGQAVTIQGISDQLQAGMTPVREAIRRLTSDGALNMMGNRRVVVPEITINCIDELEFMRKTMEPELARRATWFVTEDVIGRLMREDSALNQAISKGNISAYMTHNYRFHRIFYQTARAPILAATVDKLWLRFGPSLRVVCGRYGTMNLPDKHAEMLKALTQRDCDSAAQAMTEDVVQGMIQIRAALQTEQQFD